MHQLENLLFDNTYARLPEAFYRRVRPTALSAPYLVSFNAAAATLIGLDPEEAQRPEFVEYFCGNKLLPGSDPVAAIYAGHQFGTFVPQLGDGRAILLGEAVGRESECDKRWDVQLKGAGPTPFSRMGDGRAVLRSTIREYLCSEAMHALGIPTTRALCIVGSDEPVYREAIETAAVLTRLAPTHVRFGSFEFFYYRAQHDRVRELADYVIRFHYPHLAEDAADKYLQLLREVVRRTAQLIAQWQAVGYAHGVMNTDNMSIIGLTIDYGPFGFLDEFDTEFICNHSDYGGRYAFGQQPGVALWNLSRFAQTLLPLINREEAVAALEEYEFIFAEAYAELMRAKLGLLAMHDGDAALVNDLLAALQANNTDYARFFRRLGEFDLTKESNDLLRDMFIDPTGFDAWVSSYRKRLEAEESSDAPRRERMMKVNPKYILRNHIAQAVIARAQDGDYTEVDALLAALQHPFDEQPGKERFDQLPPVRSQRISVSCSS